MSYQGASGRRQEAAGILGRKIRTCQEYRGLLGSEEYVPAGDRRDGARVCCGCRIMGPACSAAGEIRQSVAF